MKNFLSFIIFSLLFSFTIDAQNGFGIEADIGPTVGKTRELFSYNLQANFYYLWNIYEHVNLGPTIGASIFLGEGTDEPTLFSSIPDTFIPLAVASRFELAENFRIGADIGFAFNDTGDGGGFYYKPILMYYIKEKLAFTASFSSIIESGNYTSSTINLGFNIGF